MSGDIAIDFSQGVILGGDGEWAPVPQICHVQAVPRDVMLIIFRKVQADAKERVNLGLVCKMWLKWCQGNNL